MRRWGLATLALGVPSTALASDPRGFFVVLLGLHVLDALLVLARAACAFRAARQPFWRALVVTLPLAIVAAPTVHADGVAAWPASDGLIAPGPLGLPDDARPGASLLVGLVAASTLAAASAAAREA